MSIRKVSDYPAVAAYAPGPSILKDRPQLSQCWIIPRCGWCERVHVHGTGAGQREPHCPRGPDWLIGENGRAPGYTLKFAGMIDDPKIFTDDARRTKAKYAAYLKGFEDRRKVRLAADRAWHKATVYKHVTARTPTK